MWGGRLVRPRCREATRASPLSIVIPNAVKNLLFAGDHSAPGVPHVCAFCKRGIPECLHLGLSSTILPMDQARIQKLLTPFLHEPLTADQLNNISTYVDLLLRWNARMNLTAVRDEEHIVTRHFGESLFAAHHLLSGDPRAATVADVGSGAGFPGLPIKIFAPELKLALIESNQKKATFLREVIRALQLSDAEVFNGRAADFPAASADLVTLRAVENFEDALPEAARLVAPNGRLALLVGAAQERSARNLLPVVGWHSIKLPQAQSRILLIGTNKSEPK